MTGKVIVITGASAGIGLACARECAARGATVVLSARRLERLTAAADTIAASGARAHAIEADVTREADMHALVAQTLERCGRLDVMVANAGIGYHNAFEATPPEVMRRLVDVNLMGTLLAGRAAAIQFRRQGHGHLIVMSSIVGRRGIAGSSLYSATKAAQAALVESLRAEWFGTNLKASAVYPVSTMTEFHDVIRRDFGYEVEGLGPKQSAASVASAVADCIEHPSAEVYPLGRSRWLAVANAIAPATTDRIVQKFTRRRRVIAQAER